MILPRRRAFMPGMTARATKNGPSRLAAISARQSSVAKVSSGPRWLTAALLTRISRGASRSSAAIAAATAAAWVTSNAATATEWPSRASVAAAASSLARWRPLMTTWAPAWARPRAMASPRPDPPPVTSAWRPVRSNAGTAATMERSVNPHDVAHVEQAHEAPGALAGNEAGRAQRAPGEIQARAGLVRELDALTRTGEDDAVIADDVAAAQGGKADRFRFALAGHSLAAENGVALQIAPESLRYRRAQLQR